MSKYEKLSNEQRRSFDLKMDYLNNVVYSHLKEKAEIPTAPVETDKTKAIPCNLLYPNTNDERFKNKERFHRQQTVFREPGYEESPYPEEDGAVYSTSDNLGGPKNDEAWEVAENSGCVKNSAAYFEAYLRKRFEDPDLRLVHILTGNSGMSSHSYQKYGFFAKNPKIA